MKASLAGIVVAAAAVSKSALASDSSVKVISNSLFGRTPKKASRRDKDAAVIRGLLDKDNLPTTGQEWISLPDDGSGSRVEYQPNDFADEADPDTARRLRAVRDRFLLDGAGRDRYSKQFVDGGETYYDEYAQAWRLLGFYIDCDSPYQYQSDCWGGDDEDGGGGGGEDRENGQEVQYDEDGNIVRNCVRYLLWAAVSFLMQYGILSICILACIVTRDTVL